MTNPKDLLSKVGEKVSEIKNQAAKVSRESAKTVEGVRTVVKTGLGASKVVVQKAGEVLTKEKLTQGIDATSKGIDLMAKGARIASKGAESLATQMEKAAQKVHNVKDKIAKK